MKVFRILSILFATTFLLSACLGETPTGYNPAQLGPIQVAQAERELSVTVPGESDRLLLIGRMWKNNGPGVYRNVDQLRPSVGWVIDVVIEFDLRPNLPLYRIKLRPLNMQAGTLINEGPTNYSVDSTIPSGDGDSYQITFRAPMGWDGSSVIDERGQMVSPWIFCPDCLANRGIKSLKDRQLLGNRVDDLRALKSGGRVTLDVLDFHVGKFKLKGATGQTARARAEAYDFYNGMTQAQFAAALDQEDNQRRQARVASQRRQESNGAYWDFINQTYRPLTLKGYVESQSGCDDVSYYSEADPYGFRDTNRKVIRSNNRFIKCYEQGIPEYDFAAYEAIRPDLKATEAELWANTDKQQKRYKIRTGSDQLALAERWMENAINGVNDARDGIDKTNRRIARNKQQQQNLQNLFASNQRIINQQRDNRMIFRSDGTFTTPAQQRRESTAAFEAAKRKLSAQRSTSTSSSSRSSGSRPARTTSSGNARSVASGASTGTSTGAQTAAAPELTSTVYWAQSHASRLSVGRTQQRCFGDKSICRLISVTPLHRIDSFCLGSTASGIESEGIRNAMFVNVWEVRGVTAKDLAKMKRSVDTQPPRAGVGDGHLTVKQPILKYWLSRKDANGRTNHFLRPEEAESDGLRICGPKSTFSWGRT